MPGFELSVLEYSSTQLFASVRRDGKDETVNGRVAVQGIAQGPASVGFAGLGHGPRSKSPPRQEPSCGGMANQDRAAGLEQTAEIREPLVVVGHVGRRFRPPAAS